MPAFGCVCNSSVALAVALGGVSSVLVTVRPLIKFRLPNKNRHPQHLLFANPALVEYLCHLLVGSYQMLH
jgi:hypothetical protein